MKKGNEDGVLFPVDETTVPSGGKYSLWQTEESIFGCPDFGVVGGATPLCGGRYATFLKGCLGKMATIFPRAQHNQMIHFRNIKLFPLHQFLANSRRKLSFYHYIHCHNPEKFGLRVTGYRYHVR